MALCPALRPGMVLLADRGSDSYELMSQAAATGAHLLWRIQRNRVLPVIEELPMAAMCPWSPAHATGPGSCPGPGAGTRFRHTFQDWRSAYWRSPSQVRLVTTLLDHQRYPGRELAELYHERWQAETAYLGLKVTLRGAGRVLRSGRPADAEQELYGVLIAYHAARRIATEAATETGIDPDRI